MVQPSDYKSVSKLVMSHMKPGAVTNNFLGRDDYVRLLAEGSLYAEEQANGYFLLRRCAGFYRLSYGVHGDVDMAWLPEDMPIVAEQTFPAGKDAFSPEFLRGFTPVFDRMRMERSGELAGDCSRVRTALPGECGDVMSVLRECFDPWTGCLPSEAELASDIEGQRVLVCGEPVSAVLHFKQGRASTELRHLAVSASARRQGFATELVRRYIRDAGSQKSLVWVRWDNDAAMKTYSNCGYTFDGWKSRVFMKG